jgi:hypothetical protein
MRQGCYFLAFTLSIITSSAALAKDDRAPIPTSQDIRADIGFLADDLLEGRDAGTRGYDIAARYVAARFEALGLQQAVGGSWYQPVTLAVAQLDKSVTPSLTINGRRFASGGDVAVGPFGREPRQSVEAGAVFVGYGLKSEREKIDDYAGLDVKGKFAVVLSGFPADLPSEVGAHLAAERAAAAQEAGAIGLITLPSEGLLTRVPWNQLRERSKGPAVSWVQHNGEPFSRTPAIVATAYANGPAAEALLAGTDQSLEMIRKQAARKGAKVTRFPLKARVRLDRSSIVTTAASRNVLAVLPGADPKLAKEYVLLTAHLDHLGMREGEGGKDNIYNGAMDNAAGIATMLAVAKAFADSGRPPRRSILFAAVTAEEEGLLGSQFLAKHPVLPEGGKLVAAVNLDMPVLTYEFQDIVAFGAELSTLGPVVARAAKDAGVALSPDPLPDESLFTRSDHYRFVQEGIPAIFLMTGFAGPGKEAFRHFLKTDYHQPSDQMSLPFHWEAAAKFARVNYAIAREIADDEEAPRWYLGDFFGDVFAPGAEKAAKQ